MQIPRATYRLQLQPGFGFAAAAEIVPYLFELGISHIYASPIFRARRGSRHGYDCVDPNELNPELGSQDEWEHLTAKLRAHNMGLLQDIVPNHMAFDAENRMLADVLENGPASGFRTFFDICWDHPSPVLRGRVAAPFLGRRYEACLENGEIRLIFDAAGFAAAYGDLKFPLSFETYRLILDQAAICLKTEIGDDDPEYSRLLDLLDGLESVALETDLVVRSRQFGTLKQTLWDLSGGNSAIGRCVSSCLQRFNPEPGDLDGLQSLDNLLSQQRFRLCYWKNANEEINYRRFFDINELISLCQENVAVFRHTHALLAELAAENIVTGARVDHVDGLADPEGYLLRLRRHLGDKAYILVEKILAAGESLPGSWPVQGSTGYDFAHWINALFVCRDHRERFSGIYARFSGRTDTFEKVVTVAKKHIMASRLAGDLDNLARRIKKLSGLMRFADMLTLSRLREALTEVLANFPVYRTYLGRQEARQTDRKTVRKAVSAASRSRPDLSVELEFIRDLLLGDVPSAEPGGKWQMHPEHLRAVRMFQQLSAALTAKGCEDTAFYRYQRLVSLNEVGGEPGHFGCSVERFHKFIAGRADRWPHTMNSTATHDAKRGEDVRARLNVLSEMPSEWEARLETWHGFNRAKRIETSPGPLPDRNTEYLLYQVLIGAWPGVGGVTERFVNRIKAYMIKAVREAGEHTSWLEPREEYETALEAFVGGILDESGQNPFMPDFARFCRKIAHYGLFNSLSQSLLKIAAPGVPDFYQGTELPQLALVDPDNRQPVSYRKRRQLLKIVAGGASDPSAQVRELLRNRDDGGVKLFVISRALAARRRLKKLFQTGRYVPLETTGSHHRHVVAFARNWGKSWCVVSVPRFVTALVNEKQDPLGRDLWHDTAIDLPADAPGIWQNIFTQQWIQGPGRIAVGDALQDFPVALIMGGESL